MASINGVSVKSVKEFKGHEGEPLMQATVYLNGKKLGFWSQDSWGGPDNFDFKENLLYKSYMAIRNILPDDMLSMMFNIENLMTVAVALHDVEKALKSAQKKGNAGIYLAFDVGSGYYAYSVIEKEYAIPQKIETLLSEKLKESSEQLYSLMGTDYKPYITYQYISSPEDLNLVVGDMGAVKIPEEKKLEYVPFEKPKIEKYSIKEIDDETVEFKDNLYKRTVQVPKKDIEIVKKVLDVML